jgi:hypothetical protein
MQLLTATVKSQPRIVETRFGVRSVMDVTLPNGQEQAIWGPENFMPIVTRKPGESVQLGKDSKGKFHCIEQEITQATQTKHEITQALKQKPAIDNGHNLAGQLSPEQKREIAQYITQQRDLLAFCLDQAATIPQAQTDDSVQKLGVTLYLSAQRKFGLA